MPFLHTRPESPSSKDITMDSTHHLEDPCPEQAQTKMWASRALLYNPRRQELSITKTKTIQDSMWESFLSPLSYTTCEALQSSDPTGPTAACGAYWRIELPPARQQDCWDIFIDDDEKEIWASMPDEELRNGYLIGRLNLQRLSMKDHLLRRCGKLSTIYVMKPCP